ncbi:MAG: S8 family serine peptidase [bacterium]|nr:S8 family serine peptidase [bacterium]
MKRLALTAWLALAAVTVLAPAAALADSFAGYIPGRMLLEFAADYRPAVAKSARGVAVDDPALQALADELRVSALEPLYPAVRFAAKAGAPDLSRHWVAEFDPSADLDAAAAAFAAVPGVRKAVKDELRRMDIAIPNDPGLSGQWYLRNTSYGGKDVRWLGGWQEAQGDSNVIVAVIDSGVDWHHPDLGGPHPDKVNGALFTNWTEYYGNPGSDDDHNGRTDDIRGWDFVSGAANVWPGEDATIADNNPMDFGGHGTGCAGNVAPLTGNGVGISGTAGGCKILAIRAGYLNSAGTGLVGMSWASQGIIYATDMGARVINCSWGSSSILETAVDYAQLNGVIIVAAAGNDNHEVPEFLGTADGVLSVAATGPGDEKASFSSYGTWVELSAPGAGIYTTWYDHVTASSTYASVDGTSFASPITCGSIALLWSAHPAYTREQIIDLLLTTCDDIDAINPTIAGKLGAGRVNLLKALGDGVHQVPAEFELVDDAINSAAAGDTIALAASLVLTAPFEIKDKDLTYLGGWDDAFLSRDPVGTPTVITALPTSTAMSVGNEAGPGVVVDGFRCTGGGGQQYTSIPYTGRYGGGLIVNGDAVLRNIDVTGNATGSSTQIGGGGGVLLYDSNAVLENVRVHGNTSLHGAGVYVYRGAPTLIDCEINANTTIVNNPSAPRGGGVFVTDAALTLRRTVVSGHANADLGGGIYAANSTGATTVVLDHAEISGNTAKSKGCGVYVNGGTLTAVGGLIAANVPTPAATFLYGGGICVEGGAANLDSLEVRNNSAMIAGGVAKLAGGTLTLANSVLRDNSSVFFAGGLYVDTVTGATVTGNTVAANAGGSAGGGIYFSNASATLTRNLVAANSGSAAASQGVYATGGSLVFNCNNVHGNAGGDYGGVTNPTGANGNVSADPQFCDLAAGDFTVYDTSPCLPAHSGGCGQIGALGQGCSQGTGVDDGPGQGVPAVFRVDPAFPNPFNPSTTIRFAMPAAARASVRIYDAGGRHVRTLVDGDLGAAVHTVVWQGDDDAGRRVGSGVYFYRVRAGTNEQTGPLALIK